MNCKQTENAKTCACTYGGCPRKGICCECISFHLAHQQLPGCCFTAEGEKWYDRSFAAFARDRKLG
jgi:hypothetical protein